MGCSFRLNLGLDVSIFVRILSIQAQGPSNQIWLLSCSSHLQIRRFDNVCKLISSIPCKLRAAQILCRAIQLSIQFSWWGWRDSDCSRQNTSYRSIFKCLLKKWWLLAIRGSQSGRCLVSRDLVSNSSSSIDTISRSPFHKMLRLEAICRSLQISCQAGNNWLWFLDALGHKNWNPCRQHFGFLRWHRWTAFWEYITLRKFDGDLSCNGWTLQSWDPR